MNWSAGGVTITNTNEMLLFDLCFIAALSIPAPQSTFATTVASTTLRTKRQLKTTPGFVSATGAAGLVWPPQQQNQCMFGRNLQVSTFPTSARARPMQCPKSATDRTNVMLAAFGLRGGATKVALSYLPEITHAQASAVAKLLYPVSTLPILGQTYLMTREEAECPRGAVVGFVAQTASVLLAVPVVAKVRALRPGANFIAIDWVHWLESALLHVSVQGTAMSFRQAVRAVEEEKPLPVSAIRYSPMAKTLSSLFLVIGLVGLCHLKRGGSSWDEIAFLGGILEPPSPGKGLLSFPVWIAHWSMVFDFATQLRYMQKWGDCTGNKQWKAFALLHLPYCFVNAFVILNHLNRDEVALLRLCHPVFVFAGSLALLVGAFRVVRGSSIRSYDGDNSKVSKSEGISSLKENVCGGSVPYPDWDLVYSAKSLAAGAVLSYVSLYLSR